MALEIYLIRHGEADWIRQAAKMPEPRFGGRMSQDKLTDTGKQQARAFGDYAKEQGLWPTAVHRSSAVRAVQTHMLSAEVMGLTVPVRTDPRLQELDWGEWTGQLRTLANGPMTPDRVPPGGESFHMVADRAIAALLDSAELQPDGRLFVYTHRNVIKAVVQRVTGWSLDLILGAELLSLTRLDYQDGRLRLAFCNKRTVV